ncbi:MAG: hypothetical protein OEW12_10470, partial [Deltaproteobacteria bacterium]|nr:hypothetical protein [Deltaproteobacteria bacterium]
MGDKPGGRFALALGVELLLLDGDTQAAWEILDSALGETGSAPEDFTVPWLKGARAETHFLTAMAEPDRFEAHLRKGRQSLKEAMAAEKPHPRLVLETIRLEVVLRMLQGEPHTARKALEEGEALLSDQGARLALARLYFSYAELLKGASGEDWPGWGAKALSLAAALDAGLLAAAIRQLLELEPESPQEAPLQDPPPLAQNGWGGMVHPAMAALLERLETEGPKALSGLPRGVLRVLMDGADAERGALFLPDENGVLVLTEAIPPLLPGVDWVNHWLVESAWQERQGRILDNFQPASERADALPPQSVCALVATSAKGPVGVIVLSSGMGGTVFTPDLLEPLEHLARQGGVVFAVKAALDRQREAYGRLNTEFNEWRQWVEWSLHAGAKELDQPEGLEAVLAALLKDVAEPRGFTHLVLYWRETSGGGLVPEAWISASGQPRQVEDLPRLPLDNFVSRAGEVFRNLLPARMAAPDGALPTHEEKSLMTALGGQDGLWLPIQADGTGVGLLAAVSTTRMAGLTEAAAEAAGEELRLPLRLLGPVLGRARTARLLGRETLSLRRHSTTLEGSGQQFQRFLPPSMAAHLQNETSSKTNKPGLAGPLLPGPLLPEGWEESGVVLLCGRMKGLVRLQRQVKAEGLGETRAYYRQVERALALHHGVLEKIEREEWLARIPGGTENSLWGALTLIQTLAGNQENRTGGQPPPITGLGIHRGRLLGDVVQAGDKLEA